MKVRKAVLPVAGKGTRFLPATKMVPKELLPIVDKPVIHYLVEEAVSSGIEEIIFVISKDKELIRHHFSPLEELELFLEAKGKQDLLDRVKPIHEMATFKYCYQDEPKGDGHAIIQAEELVGDEPFLVLFGDDIVRHEEPAASQLLKHFAGEPVIAVERIDRADAPQYGMVGTGQQEGHKHEVTHMVEKPTPEEAPSELGIIGKYVCPPSIFEAIRQANASHGGELRLIDGLIHLAKNSPIWAVEVQGDRYDTGRPEGLVAANKAFL